MRGWQMGIGKSLGPRRHLLPPPHPSPVAAGPLPSPPQAFVASVYFPVNETEGGVVTSAAPGDAVLPEASCSGAAA